VENKLREVTLEPNPTLKAAPSCGLSLAKTK